MSRCVACGRRLRRGSPSGLGPVCARRIGVTPAPVAARTPPSTTPVPQVPGQAELPFGDHPPPTALPDAAR